MTDAPENSENLQEIQENSEQIQELPVPKRGRGRPKGALDSAPRKRRIVEEPLPIKETVEPPEPPPEHSPEPAPTPTPTPPSGPVRMKTRRAPVRVEPAPMAVPVTPPAPPSPRTLFRQAGETIYQLQTQRENARRDYRNQAVHRSLRSKFSSVELSLSNMADAKGPQNHA